MNRGAGLVGPQQWSAFAVLSRVRRETTRKMASLSTEAVLLLGKAHEPSELTRSHKDSGRPWAPLQMTSGLEVNLPCLLTLLRSTGLCSQFTPFFTSRLVVGAD